MKATLKMVGWGVLAIVPIAAMGEAMPTAQQNAMVQKYCAVCHKDAFPNGGLSLEHFDAAKPDPGLSAMLVSKLKNGALGASGQSLPDRATQDALASALTAASAGAGNWTVNTRAEILTAGIVREVASTANKGEPDLYRLTLTCNGATRKGEMQVAWSPGVPPAGQQMSAAVDGKILSTHKLEGSEKMGNGQDGTSGPGAVVLPAKRLPAQTLTVNNVFPDQTVTFPFDALTPTARQSLAACFSSSQ